MNVEIGTESRYSFSGNTYFGILFCLCSVPYAHIFFKIFNKKRYVIINCYICLCLGLPQEMFHLQTMLPSHGFSLGRSGSRWAISAGRAGLNYFFPRGTSSGRRGFRWAIFAGIAGLNYFFPTDLFWTRWFHVSDFAGIAGLNYFSPTDLFWSRWFHVSDFFRDCRANYSLVYLLLVAVGAGERSLEGLKD
jgi:hypothetical protein